MNFIIRNAVKGDIPSLCRIEKECFSVPWSENAFESFFDNGCSVCFVAQADGELCGYAGANLSFGDCEITNVAVIEKYRRCGIARALLSMLEKNGGVEKILLDVRKSNTAAKKLYDSLGFTVDGVRKNFYSNPREDSILMSKDINKKC